MLRLSRSRKLTKLIRQEEWKQATDRCKSHPHEAGVFLTDEFIYDGHFRSDILPLHQACALQNAPLSLVETLVTSFPDGVKCRDSCFGRVPLHIALQSGASEEVIHALLAFYPQGAQALDRLHRLPLHYAISNNRSDEIIKAILQAFPQGARQMDKDGWLPLHVACYKGTNGIDIVREILHAHPFSIMSTTNAGNTPVMIANKSKHCLNRNRIISFLEVDFLSTLEKKTTRKDFWEHALDLKAQKRSNDHHHDHHCGCGDSCERNMVCSICLEDQYQGDEEQDDDDHIQDENTETFGTTKSFSCATCNNSFHKECLISWFKVRFQKSNTANRPNTLSFNCPYCRETMLSEDDLKEALSDMFHSEQEEVLEEELQLLDFAQVIPAAA